MHTFLTILEIAVYVCAASLFAAVLLARLIDRDN